MFSPVRRSPGKRNCFRGVNAENFDPLRPFPQTPVEKAEFPAKTRKKACSDGEPLEGRYLFEEMPVHKAVATLAIPTVISQLVTMVYNLADTFFSSVRSGNPVMVAAVPGLPVV